MGLAGDALGAAGYAALMALAVVGLLLVPGAVVLVAGLIGRRTRR